jgi:hypothetical protein
MNSASFSSILSHIVDLWSLLQEQNNWQSYLSDGLHLSESGNLFLWEKLNPVLDSVLLNGKTEYEIDFPNWAVTVADPVGTLSEYFTPK